MSTHECKWYSLLVFVIITCEWKKRLWIGLLITVSPYRIRSGAQPDGYSRLTSDYGLWTMDYKSWHKFHCLNKMLSHEHTGESFDATFLQTPRALWMQGTLKFQRNWSEIPKLWIQKHLFQKWTMDIYDKYIRMKCKYVKLRQDSFDCRDFLQGFLQSCFDDITSLLGPYRGCATPKSHF